MNNLNDIQKTLRDEIAMHVLTTIITRHQKFNFDYSGGENILIADCELAYKISDAMLYVREDPIDNDIQRWIKIHAWEDRAKKLEKERWENYLKNKDSDL